MFSELSQIRDYELPPITAEFCCGSNPRANSLKSNALKEDFSELNKELVLAEELSLVNSKGLICFISSAPSLHGNGSVLKELTTEGALLLYAVVLLTLFLRMGFCFLANFSTFSFDLNGLHSSYSASCSALPNNTDYVFAVGCEVVSEAAVFTLAGDWDMSDCEFIFISNSSGCDCMEEYRFSCYT